MPRTLHATDPDRALEDLAREHQVLAGMTGADSARIDALVGDVGAIKGDVRVVNSKVDHVASGINELRDALAVLVRHDLQMQQHAAADAELRKDVDDINKRTHTLELQIGPLIEIRGWLIRAGLTVLGIVGLAIVAAVIKGQA